MNLGFIGTGKIASSVITGICKSKISYKKIIISPRNKKIAQGLKRKFKKIVIAKNNQQIVDQCNWVFLSVTPTVGEKIIKDLKFKSNQSKIWGVLIFLSIVTIIEVALGILKPEVLIENSFLRMKLINWIFIILTIVKAYYIMWDFMHLRDELRGLQASVVITLMFLIGYLAFILLVEGNYIFDVMYEGFVSWNF